MYAETVILMILTESVYTRAERLSIWSSKGPDDMSEEYTVLNTETSWWEAAYSGCEDAGGRLVVPSTVGHVSLLLNSLEHGRYYWAGAFQTYTPWKWTETNEPLFKHVGDIDAGNLVHRHTIQSNSAFACFQHCKPVIRKLGLQVSCKQTTPSRLYIGRRCFCYVPDNTDHVNHPKEDKQHIIRCAGTFSEHCGGRDKISVYSIDLPASVGIISDADNTANCGYIKYDHDNGFKLGFENCRSKKGRVCPVRWITKVQSSEANVKIYICQKNCAGII
ncbi:uncharacterized protein LOC121385519 [Gigantopelta aegis]|uniref:uncharacterized protein LOC121385519 n=1 Tax=Gigantopelta aegis TaxID=1735272 RepID=UPI001B88A3FB|nr:uncharacterized protein LOC121385519 [Gigantopelta aegis]